MRYKYGCQIENGNLLPQSVHFIRTEFILNWVGETWDEEKNLSKGNIKHTLYMIL